MILAKKLAYDKHIKNVTLSKLTGISEPAISKILNGRQYPYPTEAKRIALALDYDGSVEELFSEVMS